MSRYGYSVRCLVDAFASVAPGTPEKDLRQIARDAYPFGERKHWPYKMWLKATKAVIADRLRLERWNDNANGGGT